MLALWIEKSHSAMAWYRSSPVGSIRGRDPRYGAHANVGAAFSHFTFEMSKGISLAQTGRQDFYVRNDFYILHGLVMVGWLESLFSANLWKAFLKTLCLNEAAKTKQSKYGMNLQFLVESPVTTCHGVIRSMWWDSRGLRSLAGGRYSGCLQGPPRRWTQFDAALKRPDWSIFSGNDGKWTSSKPKNSEWCRRFVPEKKPTILRQGPNEQDENREWLLSDPQAECEAAIL